MYNLPHNAALLQKLCFALLGSSVPMNNAHRARRAAAHIIHCPGRFFSSRSEEKRE